MPRTTVYEFTVEGTHEFPVDMLRYDACWPRTTEDAVEMKLAPHSREELSRQRKVTLITHAHAPTAGRWESFGWKVTSEEVHRY